MKIEHSENDNVSVDVADAILILFDGLKSCEAHSRHLEEIIVLQQGLLKQLVQSARLNHGYIEALSVPASASASNVVVN